jgi:hypothetical protein
MAEEVIDYFYRRLAIQRHILLLVFDLIQFCFGNVPAQVPAYNVNVLCEFAANFLIWATKEPGLDGLITLVSVPPQRSSCLTV